MCPVAMHVPVATFSHAQSLPLSRSREKRLILFFYYFRNTADNFSSFNQERVTSILEQKIQNSQYSERVLETEIGRRQSLTMVLMSSLMPSSTLPSTAVPAMKVVWSRHRLGLRRWCRGGAHAFEQNFRLLYFFNLRSNYGDLHCHLVQLMR